MDQYTYMESLEIGPKLAPIPFFIEKGKLCIVMHKYMCDGHAYVMQVCNSTLSRKEQITIKLINLHRKFRKILQVMRLNQILCVDIKAQNTLLNYDETASLRSG